MVTRVLLAIVALGGARAHAGDGDEPDRVDRIYELPGSVEITGRPLRADPFEATRDVTQLGAAAIRETQARDMAEALEATPGVFMQRTNRGAGAPLLRGLIGPQNLLVVDGVRFNLATFRTGPNQYLSLFDPHALQRIEVLRGPSSVRYGNGAMGGVVQLVTRPLAAPGGRLEIRPRGVFQLSSADGGVTAAAAGALTWRGLGVNLGVTAEHLGRLRTGAGESVPASELRRLFWRAKAGYVAPRWALTAAYFGGAVGPAARVDNLGRGELRRYDDLDHFAYTRFDWHPRDSPMTHLRVAVGYHGLTERVERFNCRTVATNDAHQVVANLSGCGDRAAAEVQRTRRNEDRVHGVNADVSLGFAVWDGRLELQWGGDIGWDQVAASARVDGHVDNGFEPEVKPRGHFGVGSTFVSTGAFISATITPLSLSGGTYRLLAHGGARVSYFEADANEVPGLGALHHEHTGVVGSGGLQLVIADTLNVYANLVQGFRAPNLQETTVLGDTGNFFEVPNADLRPERSDTVEVGARLNVAPLEVSASFFHSWLDGAIERAPTTYNGSSELEGKGVRHRVNATSGVYKGVEGEVSVRLSRRLTLGASVTWVAGDLTSADGVTEPARRIPPVFGSARLRYDAPELAGYAEAFTRWAGPQDRLSSGDRDDLRICETTPFSGVLSDPCRGSPGWATVGLRAGVQPTEELRVDVQISNVTDASYRAHGSGLDAPGLDLRLRLEVGL